ncbi:L,D-transpeptidase family protein [Bdellovibrio bacteriovorus]|uniref:L,D-transpeptidase family protein n=1 Tax=Bdellovibrio bacteriovorus TaxID=959 RepID=UPI003A7F834B
MSRKISILNILKGLAVSAVIIGVLAALWRAPFFSPLRLKILGYKTVGDRLEQYETSVTERLSPFFLKAGASYPPEKVILLFIKSKNTLSVYSEDSQNKPQYIKTYRVLAASGKPGPKLKEGDNQVPEGIYSIESLNPNSSFHLSLKVNYPNTYDIKRGKEDGRTQLGSDIMIHGKSASVGCIAIGDEAIEELFILAAKSKYRRWKLISSPIDFRETDITPQPWIYRPWIPDLYAKIKSEVLKLPLKTDLQP